LGCIQPMSSPMMKRMLGFCGCCASAGREPPQKVTTAVAAAITLKSNLRFTDSSSLTAVVNDGKFSPVWRSGKSAREPEIGLQLHQLALGATEWSVSVISAVSFDLCRSGRKGTKEKKALLACKKPRHRQPRLGATCFRIASMTWAL